MDPDILISLIFLQKFWPLIFSDSWRLDSLVNFYNPEKTPSFVTTAAAVANSFSRALHVIRRHCVHSNWKDTENMMFMWRVGKSSLRSSPRPLCTLPTHTRIGQTTIHQNELIATPSYHDSIGKARHISTSSQQPSDTKSSTGTRSSNSDPTTLLLDRALEHHVLSLGFSHAALVAAARDLGLSPSITAILERSSSSGGSADRPPHSATSQEGHLISHFVTRCDALLMVQLRERREELAAMPLRQRIATAIRLRLEMVKPHMERWPDALATLAKPENSAGALKQLGVMVDNIWHALGDSSTDMRWYTKRAVLAGVYVSTQVGQSTHTCLWLADCTLLHVACMDKSLEANALCEFWGDTSFIACSSKLTCWHPQNSTFEIIKICWIRLEL